MFLGLLGTFWGLLETVHSISGVIDSMKTGSDTTTMFDDLKSGLSAPIAGMSVSFTSSLFGLAGSLILGFLDLQAGQAQNRFYTELEDFLASHVETAPPPAVVDEASRALGRRADSPDQRKSAAAMANLAEGIQALVGAYAPGAAADPRLGRGASRAAGRHSPPAAPSDRRARKADLIREPPHGARTRTPHRKR